MHTRTKPPLSGAKRFAMRLKAEQKSIVFLLRIVAGWLMFYAGISKVLDPSWSAAGFLTNAATFPKFFAWFAQPGILPITNFLNEWGLVLIGVSLVLGAFIRVSATLSVVLMLLYYFPSLDFPYAGEHGFLVDNHIIYAVAFAFLAAIGAGRYHGVDGWLLKKPFFAKRKMLRSLLG